MGEAEALSRRVAADRDRQGRRATHWRTNSSALIFFYSRTRACGEPQLKEMRVVSLRLLRWVGGQKRSYPPVSMDRAVSSYEQTAQSYALAMAQRKEKDAEVRAVQFDIRLTLG